MKESKSMFRYFGYCSRCYAACVILSTHLPDRKMFKCSRCQKKKQNPLNGLTQAIKNLKI